MPEPVGRLDALLAAGSSSSAGSTHGDHLAAETVGRVYRPVVSPWLRPRLLLHGLRARLRTQ